MNPAKAFHLSGAPRGEVLPPKEWTYVNLRIPIAIKQCIEAEAKRLGVSQNHVVNDWLEQMSNRVVQEPEV